MVSISVVVPVWNGQEHLAETLDSILGQTYPPLEVIVVNDGSVDKTLEILATYGSRVTVLTIENHGVEYARNYGVSKAKGEWIALCDHDDLWLPEKLQKQVALIDAAPEIHYVLCDYADWTNGEVSARSHLSYAPADFWKPEVLPEGWIIREPIAAKLVRFQPTITSVALVRRDYYLASGGCDPSIRGNPAEDTCLHFRCLMKVPFGVVPQTLMLYRRHLASVSADGVRQLQASVDIWEHILKNYPEAGPVEQELRNSLVELRAEARTSAKYRRRQKMKRMLSNFLGKSA